MAQAAFDSNGVGGSIVFDATSGGDGVSVTVSLAFSDASAAESVGHNYHIHVDSAPADGIACSATGGHYDPTKNEAPKDSSFVSYSCDPDLTDECYTGDLSGKHGKVTIAGNDTSGNAAIIQFTDTEINIDDLFGRSVTASVLLRATRFVLCEGRLSVCMLCVIRQQQKAQCVCRHYTAFTLSAINGLSRLTELYTGACSGRHAAGVRHDRGRRRLPAT